MKAEGNHPWGFGLHSWGCFKLGFTASFCPLALNSNPRKWVIPQRWIKTWAFKNAGSSENRSGKEEVGEDVCVGTGHRSCPGCTWWAFFCVQRTAMQVTHLFCPHIPSFLLAVLADWSHQRWWGRCKRITHWRTTQSWRLPLPSAKYGHQIQLLSYNVNRHQNLWMMNQRSPLSHTGHNVPAPGRLHCRKPMCSRWGVFVVLVLIAVPCPALHAQEWGWRPCVWSFQFLTAARQRTLIHI